MAPVTRSSLQGRPISNESSWHDLGEPDIVLEHDTDELDEASDAVSPQDLTAEDSSSEHGFDGMAHQRRHGTSSFPSTFSTCHV
jgi:hypothetical protein